MGHTGVVVAGALVTLLLAAGTVWMVIGRRERRHRRRREATTGDDGGLSQADVVDIEAGFARADAESASVRGAMIESRLLPLLARGVPLQLVDVVPELHAARLRFADGTAFGGRGETSGDAGVLAATLWRHRVCPARCHSDELGTHVEFDGGRGRRPVSIILTGLEQAV